jgi:hypothetical protein
VKPETIAELRKMEEANRGFYPDRDTYEEAWNALPGLLDAAEQYNGTTLQAAIKFVEIAEAHMETARVLADLLTEDDTMRRIDREGLKRPISPGLRASTKRTSPITSNWQKSVLPCIARQRTSRGTAWWWPMRTQTFKQQWTR